MTNTQMINSLAMSASNNEDAFAELYMAIDSQFSRIVSGYLNKNNLTGFNFDIDDYLSATAQAMWESVEGYDSEKGSFLARVTTFANYRMKAITDFNLARKRFDKSKQSYSFDELFESEAFDLEADENSTEAEKLVSEFVKNDKDGIVIEIMSAVTDSKVRNNAFTKHFGQYGATERKRVQRVRERLQAYLTSNGVSI